MPDKGGKSSYKEAKELISVAPPPAPAREPEGRSASVAPPAFTQARESQPLPPLQSERRMIGGKPYQVYPRGEAYEDVGRVEVTPYTAVPLFTPEEPLVRRISPDLYLRTRSHPQRAAVYPLLSLDTPFSAYNLPAENRALQVAAERASRLNPHSVVAREMSRRGVERGSGWGYFPGSEHLLVGTTDLLNRAMGAPSIYGPQATQYRGRPPEITGPATPLMRWREPEDQAEAARFAMNANEYYELVDLIESLPPDKQARWIADINAVVGTYGADPEKVGEQIRYLMWMEQQAEAMG